MKDGAVEVPALKRSVALPIALPAEGTAVTLGIRPEHVELVQGDALRVDLTEALGGVSYAYLSAHTGERLIVEERGDERSHEDAHMGIAFEPSRAMLFDTKTEARIR